MKILTNTWAGFAEEILISLIASSLLMIAFYNVGALNRHSTTDIAVVYIFLLICLGAVLRIIRWAIVYHAPIYLFFLHFPAFIAIFIGIMTLNHNKDFYSILTSSLLIFISVIYFAIMYIKRREIIKKSPPGYRIQRLRWKMKMRERLTLVFPDRYIKFLETGDERFLKGDE